MKVSFAFFLVDSSKTSTIHLSTVTDSLTEIPATPKIEKDAEASVVDDLFAESAVVAYSILFTMKGSVDLLRLDLSLSTHSELILNL